MHIVYRYELKREMDTEWCSRKGSWNMEHGNIAYANARVNARADGTLNGTPNQTSNNGPIMGYSPLGSTLQHQVPSPNFYHLYFWYIIWRKKLKINYFGLSVIFCWYSLLDLQWSQFEAAKNRFRVVNVDTEVIFPMFWGIWGNFMRFWAPQK